MSNDNICTYNTTLTFTDCGLSVLRSLIGQQEARLASDWLTGSEALHGIYMTTGMGLLGSG